MSKNSKRIYQLYLFSFVLQTFLKSIPALLSAPNYSLLFKLHILFLEKWFLSKTIYSIIFKKTFTKESFLGYSVRFLNYLEFLTLFLEIFGIQEYRLNLKKKNLKILDCGSSWGMSVIYFKHFYPDCSITAVEANKNTLLLLEKNLKKNSIKNTIIQNYFVGAKKGIHNFYMFDFDGWSASDTGSDDFIEGRNDFVTAKIKSIALSQLLSEKIDVLKLDIEGMEGEALISAQKQLKKVSEIIIEYHSGMNVKNNKLLQIRKALKDAGMKIDTINTKSLFTKKDSMCIIHAEQTNIAN